MAAESKPRNRNAAKRASRPSQTSLVAPLTDAERALVDAHRERVRLRAPTLPKLSNQAADGTTTRIPLPDMSTAERMDLFRAQLAAATGSDWTDTGFLRFCELLEVMKHKGAKNPDMATAAALGEVLDIGPRDVIEGQLAAQMVAVHHVAITLLSALGDGSYNSEIARFQLTTAEKLLRLYMDQVTALSAYRGKGPVQQRVVVEHVEVHGGQAVVGAVAPVGGGGLSAQS